MTGISTGRGEFAVSAVLTITNGATPAENTDSTCKTHVRQRLEASGGSRGFYVRACSVGSGKTSTRSVSADGIVKEAARKKD